MNLVPPVPNEIFTPDGPSSPSPGSGNFTGIQLLLGVIAGVFIGVLISRRNKEME